MKISVIGLGYVGLPLFLELSKNFMVQGFDHDSIRVNELKRGFDKNDNTNNLKLKKKNNLISNNLSSLINSNVFIITLPTPINKKNHPDIKNIINITNKLSKIIKKDDLIIYESTFYPGLTEEILIPILEKGSNLICRYDNTRNEKNFSVGYSPERVNPGDKNKNIKNINKIISATNKKALIKMNKIYSSFVKVGLHKTSNIKTAEASKVIENIQRDLNIALMNELSTIFTKMDINTSEVLDAASTKWNFVKFEPGFVGGHCIGIDPYYLAFKAKKIGIKPKIILQGRYLNESMAKYASKMIVKRSQEIKVNFDSARVLIMGFSFKENCNDIRNSKIFDIYQQLKKTFTKIDVFDPLVDLKDVKKMYDINMISSPSKAKYDVVIVAVKHEIFKKNSLQRLKINTKKKYILFDLKNTYPNLRSHFSL